MTEIVTGQIVRVRSRQYLVEVNNLADSINKAELLNQEAVNTQVINNAKSDYAGKAGSVW